MTPKGDIFPYSKASVLQHPQGSLAPASTSANANPDEGLLGAVPHTIRGSLHNYQQVFEVFYLPEQSKKLGMRLVAQP